MNLGRWKCYVNWNADFVFTFCTNRLVHLSSRLHGKSNVIQPVESSSQFLLLRASSSILQGLPLFGKNRQVTKCFIPRYNYFYADNVLITPNLREEANMNRLEAMEIVKQYVKSENLIRHMLAVEAAMRFYAEKFGEDVETWGITGLLHDFDWEIHPTLEQHPQAGAPILRQHGVSEEIVRAILSHADHTGVPRQTRMEKALYACDEITGLITAVALVRPSRSLEDLEARSVKKKWKDRAFAAGANREEIARAAEEFGIELWEHVDNVIQAMRRIAPELGF